ncbi:MAG TPA: hypothetical protein VMU80_11415 [Bryobacteraceae bacterium]|nr:hypothetical protein [Bryobacteraceae bacterium]
MSFLLVASVHARRDAPKIVYGTYLGGRDKECATGIAVGHSGDAYIVGRTPSPAFPVTPGAFSTKTNVNNNDWVGFVSRISPHGDRLVYSSFIGGNFRSSANAAAVDSQGRAFVGGSTCSSTFPTTQTAVLRTALERLTKPSPSTGKKNRPKEIAAASRTLTAVFHKKSRPETERHF